MPVTGLIMNPILVGGTARGYCRTIQPDGRAASCQRTSTSNASIFNPAMLMRHLIYGGVACERHSP